MNDIIASYQHKEAAKARYVYQLRELFHDQSLTTLEGLQGA